MLINSDTHESGYTLVEMLVVITMLALVSCLAMPGHSFIKHLTSDSGTSLLHWLTRVESEASENSYPEKICISENTVSILEYREKKWQRLAREFHVPVDDTLDAECEFNDYTDNDCCFLVDSSGLYPEGKIEIHEKSGRAYVSQWGGAVH